MMNGLDEGLFIELMEGFDIEVRKGGLGCDLRNVFLGFLRCI